MHPDLARDALRARRADTVERLRDLDASFEDIVEASRDSNLDDEHDTEGATIAATRAQVSALAASGRQQLADIDRALARIESGDHGRCEGCGGAIESDRLEALPATTSCIGCARASSRR